MSTRPYHWTFASEEVSAELGGQLESLLENGEEVKANPVRRVVRSGDYFLKFDRRGAARLRGEWKSAKLLAHYGIPVVEHLGCGDSPEGGCLITRALPDSEAVAEYYWRTFVRDGEDPEPFLKRFIPFLRCLLTSGLFHPDLHIGNILYDRTNRRFALVDVRGVRKAGPLDRYFRSYRMHRIVMELREVLSRERQIRLIEECGIPDAEAFYVRALDREADALWREWPKRRRQILAGYSKFTRKIDGVLHTVNPLREIAETIDCEVVKDPPGELEGVFLAHFFLQMALIPHRCVMGFDPDDGVVYLEPQPPVAVPGRARDQRERLAAFDLNSEVTDWLKSGKGSQARLFNLYEIGRHL